MDEARTVIERLRRIEDLERRLLGEVRALLVEGERWVAAEGPGTEAAAAALDRCRELLRRPRVAAS